MLINFDQLRALCQEVWILAAKNLPNTAVIGDYLAKRSNDRAAALADLRKVNTSAELDHLLEKTLGEEAVAAREPATRPESLNAPPRTTPETPPRTSHSSGGSYTQADITGQIAAVHGHVAEPNFDPAVRSRKSRKIASQPIGITS